MKVALLFYAKDFLGGAERRLLRVYSELAEENISYDVIVFGCNKERFEDILKKADCEVKNKESIYVFEKKIQCMKFLTVHTAYDVIHFVDTSNFNITVAALCKLKQIHSLFSVCNYYIARNVTSKLTLIKTKLLLKLSSHVDLLYPSSYNLINKMTKQKVTVTPGTFTNLDFFHPKKKEKLILFAAARLEEGKNPMLALSAVNIEKEYLRDNGYYVKVLGRGYEEEKLRNYIAEHGISDIVEISGYLRTSEVLPRAAVFLSLQKLENYPSQSLAEAIACGCYVIVTDVGDSRKCANDDFSDFISSDPNELANAIRTYIDKNDKAKKNIVEVARNYALINYNISKSKDYFKKLLLQTSKNMEVKCNEM